MIDTYFKIQPWTHRHTDTHTTNIFAFKALIAFKVSIDSGIFA